MDALTRRAGNRCELCGSDSNPHAHLVDAGGESDPDKHVLLCDTCLAAYTAGQPLEGGHWYCLQESAWSEVAAVQVVSYRLLHRLEGQSWASDLLGQMYLEDEVLAWARRGLDSVDETTVEPVDCNGTTLCDGDSVTLVKDLNVKGANFTAKRGTTVKNIRVGDDPTHVEGRVNKVSIMLKTCFLKRVSQG
jgi:protein PhnA